MTCNYKKRAALSKATPTVVPVPKPVVVSTISYPKPLKSSVFGKGRHPRKWSFPKYLP